MMDCNPAILFVVSIIRAGTKETKRTTFWTSSKNQNQKQIKPWLSHHIQQKRNQSKHKDVLKMT